MEPCQICEHQKIQAIHGALDGGRLPGVVAAQYRLDKHALINHLKICLSGDACVSAAPTVLNGDIGAEPQGLTHKCCATTVEPTDDTSMSPLVPSTPIDILKLGLPYVRQAVKLAGNNQQEQERIVATLNDVLQSENMGLP